MHSLLNEIQEGVEDGDQVDVERVRSRIVENGGGAKEGIVLLVVAPEDSKVDDGRACK